MTKFKKGTNQYRRKYKGIKTDAQRDILVIFLGMLLMCFISREWQHAHPPISPCPMGGCLVSKAEASEALALVELNQIKKTSLEPTKANIIKHIADTFAPEGTAVVVRAINCFYSESGLRTEAVNNKNKNGTIDRGVAQINSIHKMLPADAHDFRKNIQKAYQIYKNRGNSFQAWYGKNCN